MKPLPPDIVHMPRLASPQQRLDEERGISPRGIIEGALRMTIGGPSWLIVQIADVIEMVLDKLGFEIVPKVAKRED